MSDDASEAWKGEEPKSESRYGLVWRFVDQSPAFTLGVEMGIIYERMLRREQTIEATVHSTNDEDLHNLANTFEYAVELNALGDEGFWLRAKLTRL